MPGLRIVDKYAVLAGGGQNHRMRLDDMVLIKDNHIALHGNITQAVAKARSGTRLPIVVECDTLEQVAEALAAKPERIMLDNMSNDMMREAVKQVAGAVALEASGGVSLETVRAIAQTGVNYISIGKLTHSAPAADIGADIALES
jgi:nicotinate-nucleotide pyrophosphorylase (carboxylating)